MVAKKNRLDFYWAAASKCQRLEVMTGEQESSSEIARSLEDGWHYQPDWRNRVVESYLVEHGEDAGPLVALKDEHDAYVRQFYMFRRTAGCLGKEAVRWAYQCHKHDASTGAGALIKAMTVAGIPAKEIAERLRTKASHVAMFLRIYFDVDKYLSERSWLASIVFRRGDEPPTLAEFRERHWLTAALIGGREALDRAISRKVPTSNEEREALLGEIRSALTVRAHEYVESLQRGMVQPGPADFERLLRLLDALSRQPPPDKQATALNNWIQAIHKTIVKPMIAEISDTSDSQAAVSGVEAAAADAGKGP